MDKPFDQIKFAKSLEQVYNPSQETLDKAEGVDLEEGKYSGLSRAALVASIKEITGEGKVMFDLVNLFNALEKIEMEEGRGALTKSKFRTEIGKCAKVLRKLGDSVNFSQSSKK